MKQKTSSILGILLLGAALGFSGCGGENKDAAAFCDCVAKLESGQDSDQCDKDMEQMEEDFKKDQARYDAFKTAAMKKCPTAAEIIERMN
jgi:hypothetical protein